MTDKKKTFNPRVEFGKAAVKLGKEFDNVMVLAADLARTCNVLDFADNFPERFLNVGICEQNMIGIAAGLSFEGKVPICTSIAPFLYMRACEQIRTDICYNNLHAIFVPVMSGISGAPLGSTHYGLEDLSITRAFPNMKVLQPSNAVQLEKALFEAYESKGPVYIRLGSGEEPDVDSVPKGSLIGNAVKLRSGDDVAILATGYMVHKALEAAGKLEQSGISAEVWDHPSVKPVDSGSIKSILQKDKKPEYIFTLEEHNIRGGFGSAVAEVIAEYGCGVPLISIGIPDIFIGVGSREDLLRFHNLDTESIVKKISDYLGSSK